MPKSKPRGTNDICSEASVLDNLRWKKSYQDGPGFINPRSRCYIYAPLQTLLRVPVLAQFFLKKCYSKVLKRGKEVKASKKPSFTEILERLADEVHKGRRKPSGRRVEMAMILPTELLNNIGRMDPKYLEFNPGSCRRFLSLVLDILVGEWEELQGQGASAQGGQDSPTPFHWMFGSIVAKKVSCSNCGDSTTTGRSYMEFRLTMPHGVTSVEGALSRKFATKTRNRFCSKCGLKTHVESCESVVQPPTAMILAILPRKGQDEPMKTTFKMDLQLKVSGPEKSVDYVVTGVIVHMARGKGHFFACVRTPSGYWRKLDDSTAVEVTEQDVLKEQPYILFYSRRESPSSCAPSGPPRPPPSSTSKGEEAAVGNARDIGTPAEMATADRGTGEEAAGSSGSVEATSPSASDLESSRVIRLSPGDGDGGSGGANEESDCGEARGRTKPNRQMKRRRGAEESAAVEGGFGERHTLCSPGTPTSRNLTRSGAYKGPEEPSQLLQQQPQEQQPQQQQPGREAVGKTRCGGMSEGDTNKTRLSSRRKIDMVEITGADTAQGPTKRQKHAVLAQNEAPCETAAGLEIGAVNGEAAVAMDVEERSSGYLDSRVQRSKADEMLSGVDGGDEGGEIDDGDGNNDSAGGKRGERGDTGERTSSGRSKKRQRKA